MKRYFPIIVSFLLMSVFVLMASNQFLYRIIIKEAPELTFSNDEAITNTTDGTVSITDGTNTLMSIADDGTTGYLTTDRAAFADSFRVGSGTYIRKIYMTAGGDSLGLIYYDSVESATDTVFITANAAP